MIKVRINFSSDVNTIVNLIPSPEFSEKGISDLIALTFIPEPNTLFKNIFCLSSIFYKYNFEKTLISKKKLISGINIF